MAYDYFGKRRITVQVCQGDENSNNRSTLDVASNLDFKFRNSTETITQIFQISKVVSKAAHCEDEDVIKVSVEPEINDI